MSTSDATLVKGAGVLRALDLALGIGDPIAALFAEVAQKRLAIVRIVDPNAPWPSHTLAKIRAGKPVMVMIGDDPPPGGRSAGPGAWRIRDSLREWCSAAVVHGAMATAEQYRYFAASAQLYRCLAFIECDHATAIAWAEAIAAERTLILLPDPEAPQPSRGSMQ